MADHGQLNNEWICIPSECVLCSCVNFGKTILVLPAIPIDGFRMTIKRPTSGGQTRNQEAVVQHTFHLERSSLFYLSVLMT